MNDPKISSRSLASISEQYEGALIRAAFRILEEEEMKQLLHPDPMDLQAERACLKNEPIFRRRLRSRRAALCARHLTHRSLPRFARLAAALISLLAIGAGMALAASEDVREWAAGILTPPVVLEGETFSFGHSVQYADGAVLDDTLYAVSALDGRLYAYRSTDSEPLVLRCAQSPAPSVARLAAYEGDLYALSPTFAAADASGPLRFDLSETTGAELSRVIFNDDGTYALEPMLLLTNDQLYATGGGAVSDRQITGMALGSGELLLSTEWTEPRDGYFFGLSHLRLIAVDLESGGVDELIPTAEDEQNCLSIAPFYGDAEQALVAVSDPSDGSVRIVRVRPDLSVEPLAAIASANGLSAHLFGYDPQKNTLYYHQNNALCAMPDCDPARICQAAVTASAEVRGLPIGENSYAIVNLENIRIFDLDEAPDVSGGSLTIDGGFASRKLIDAFIAENRVSITETCADWETAASDIRSGAAATDLYDSYNFEQLAFDLIRQNLRAPIPSELLRGEISKLLPGVREICMEDGELLALPTDVFLYADATFFVDNMSACGYAQSDLPSTWMELLQFLCDHAQREQTVPVTALCGGGESFPAVVMDRLVAAWLRNPENARTGFQTDKMTALLEVYREIDFSRFLCADPAEGGLAISDGLLSMTGGEDLDPDFLIGVPLVLPIAAGEPAVARASCDLVTLNPNSANGELAARFLETVYARDGEKDGHALLSGQPDGSGDPDVRLCRALYDDVSFDLLFNEKTADYDAFLAVIQPFIAGETDIPAFTAQLDAFFGL